MSEFPEHDKLHRIKDKSQAVGEFIEWMRGRGIEFCLYDEEEDELVPFQDSIEKILASYFGIDPAKLEEEKRQMIRMCQEATSEKKV